MTTAGYKLKKYMFPVILYFSMARLIEFKIGVPISRARTPEGGGGKRISV